MPSIQSTRGYEVQLACLQEFENFDVKNEFALLHKMKHLNVALGWRLSDDVMSQ